MDGKQHAGGRGFGCTSTSSSSYSGLKPKEGGSARGSGDRALKRERPGPRETLPDQQTARSLRQKRAEPGEKEQRPTTTGDSATRNTPGDPPKEVHQQTTRHQFAGCNWESSPPQKPKTTGQDLKDTQAALTERPADS